MKKEIFLSFMLLLISCHRNYNECVNKREKPFLKSEKIEKLLNKSYNHFIMINGCSLNSRSYLKLALNDYLSQTNYKPISKVTFLKYRDEGYKYEMENDENDVISGCTLFEVYLKVQGQDDSLVIEHVVAYADGQSIFIEGP